MFLTLILPGVSSQGSVMGKEEEFPAKFPSMVREVTCHLQKSAENPEKSREVRKCVSALEELKASWSIHMVRALAMYSSVRSAGTHVWPVHTG